MQARDDETMRESDCTFRVMVIELENDDIVLDRFCDAVVLGMSRKGCDGDGTDGNGSRDLFSATNGDYKVAMMACVATDEALKDAKINTINKFFKHCGIKEDIKTFLDSLVEDEDE